MPEPVNPIVGAFADGNRRERRTPEVGGFLRERTHPDATGDDPDVEVCYYPPPDSAAPRIDPVNRRVIRFGLRFGERRRNPSYVRTPYYYELVPDTDADRPQDHLHFFLDRDVELVLPEGTERRDVVPIPGFAVAYPEVVDWRGMTITRYLRVTVHRHQLEAAVPQSPMDAFALESRPLRWTANPRPLVRLNLFALEGPTGVTMQFITEATSVDSRGLAEPVTETLIATLTLTSFQPQYRGAYYYRVEADRRSTSRMRVSVLLSRNIRAQLSVNGSGRDLLAVGGRVGLATWLRGFFADFVDLRMRQVARVSHVPRPDRHRRIEADSVSDLATPEFLEVRTLRDPRREALIDGLSLGIGFLPVVGDLLDLGELVHALVTGEDLQGRAVTDADLVLMGLAVLPSVPSAVRHLNAQIDAAGSALRAGGITSDRIGQLVESIRPRLAAALRAGSGDAAVRALRDEARVRAVVDHGRLRDPELLRAVRRSADD